VRPKGSRVISTHRMENVMQDKVLSTFRRRSVTEKLPAISISAMRPPHTIPHSDNDTLVASLHAARIRHHSHSSSRRTIHTDFGTQCAVPAAGRRRRCLRRASWVSRGGGSEEHGYGLKAASKSSRDAIHTNRENELSCTPMPWNMRE
jgi:hypothetical protein